MKYSAIFQLLIAAVLLLISGKNADAQATPPAWWNWTVDGTEDASVAAQGQAKYLFDLALQYLDTELYEVGGAGVAINDMMGQPWFIDTTHDLKAVQLGQLKTLAAPFYQRLTQVGFDTTNINSADPTSIYPWTDTAADDQDDALANIGQLKYVYQFELPVGFVPTLVPGTDADGDGFDDYIEWNTYVKFDENDAYDSILTIFPYDDFDADHLTNAQEESIALDGTSPDSDSDFFKDGVGIDGFIIREYWHGIGSGLLSDLKSFDNTTEKYPGLPSDFHYIDSTEIPSNWVDTEGATLTNYGARMRGLIKPPVTGTYELTLTADNGVEADLWVSRDASVFNRYPRLPLVSNSSQSVTLDFIEGARYYFEVNYAATTQDVPVSLAWRVTSTAGTNPLPVSEVISPSYLSNPNPLPNSSWAFDEGIGNTAANQATDPTAQSATFYDSFNSGTPVPGPLDDSRWIDGALGNAFTFDGSGSYVQLDAQDDPLIDGEFALSVWVFIENPNENRYMRFISQKRAWGNQTGISNIEGYELEYNPHERRLTFCGRYTEQFFAYDVDLSNGWNHVALSFSKIPESTPEAFEPILYINGIRLAQYDLDIPGNATTRYFIGDGWENGGPKPKNPQVMDAVPPSIRPLTFGSHAVVTNYNAGNHLNGSIDEIRIFDRAIGDDVAFEFLKIAAIEEEKTNPENWESSAAWVNEAPEAEWYFPADGDAFPIYEPIKLVASAYDFENQYVRIQFYEDGQPVGDPIDPIYDTTTGLPHNINPIDIPYERSVVSNVVGFKTYHYVATDRNGASTTSESITIEWYNPPPEIEWTSPQNFSRFVQGSDVELKAKITDPSLFVNEVYLREVGQSTNLPLTPTQTGDIFTFVYTHNQVGSKELQIYAVDNLGKGNLSAPITINFEAANPDIRWEFPADGYRFQTGATTPLSVRVVPNGANIVSVSFYEGSTLLGAGTSDPSDSNVYTFDYTVATPSSKTVHAEIVISNPSLTLPTEDITLTFTSAVGNPPSLTPSVTAREEANSNIPGFIETILAEAVPSNATEQENAFASHFNNPSGLTFLDGWTQNFWLGDVFVWKFPWVYHNEHGWLWLDAAANESYWMYSPEDKWLFATETDYPWMWSEAESTWLLYEVGTDDPRWFFQSQTATWKPDTPIIIANPGNDLPDDNILPTATLPDFPSQYQEYADEDGDGILNIHEHLLGTNINASETLGDASSSPQVILSTLASEVQVTESGASQTAIPLAIVPGISGMTPEVSVSYSSQGGDGLLGVGWSLSGLSSISRAPASLAVDGYVGQVNYDANDALYLDGQRLIEIAPGEYRTEIESFNTITLQGTLSSSNSSFIVETKAGLTMEYGTHDGSRMTQRSDSKALSWHLRKVSDNAGNYYQINYLKDKSEGFFFPTSIEYTANDSTGLKAHSSVQFIYEKRPDPSSYYRYGILFANHYRIREIRSYHEATRFRTYEFKYEVSEATDRSLLRGIVTRATDGTALLPTVFEWDDTPTQHTISGDWGLIPGRVNSDGNHRIFYGDYDADGIGDIANIYEDGGNSKLLSMDIYYSNGGQFIKEKVLDRVIQFEQDEPHTKFFAGDYDGDGDADFIAINRVGGYTTSDDGGMDDFTFFENPGTRGTPWTVSSIPYDNTLSSLSREQWVQSMFQESDFNGDGLTDLAMARNEGGNVVIDVFVRESTKFVRQNWFSGNISWPGEEVYYNQYWRLGDFNGDSMMDIFRTQNVAGNIVIEIFLNTYDTQSGTRKFVRTEQSHLQTMRYRGYQQWFPADFNSDGVTDITMIQGKDIYIFLSESGLLNRRKLDIDLPYEALENVEDPATINFAFANYTEGRVKWRLGDMYGDGRIDLIQISPGKKRYKRNGKQLIEIRDRSLVNVYNFVQPSADEEFKIDFKYYPQEELPNLWGSGEAFVSDFTGNGKMDLMWIRQYDADGANDKTSFSALSSDDSQLDLMVNVKNGLEVETQITYKPLTNIKGTVYTKGQNHAATLPGSDRKYDVIGPRYVVSEIKKDTGLDQGGNPIFSTHTYHYEKLVSSVHRGNLGFRSVRVTDDYAGALTTITHTDYKQEFPFTGMVELTRTTLGDGTTKVSESSVTDFGDLGDIGGFLEDPKLHFPVAEIKTEKTYEPDDPGNPSPYSITTTTMLADQNHYDAWGNVLKMEVALGDAVINNQFVTTTVNNYTDPSDPDYPKWGRLTQATVTKTSPTAPTQSRTSHFTYYASGENGGHEYLLKSEIVEPGTADELTTEYIYDPLGNIVGTTVSGADITSRSSYTIFDAHGRFPVFEVNALGHTTQTQYDSVSGTVLKVTGPNNLSTENIYDSFDRLITVKSPDSSQAYTKRLRPEDSGDTNLPVQAVTSVKTWTDAATGAYSLVHYDRLGRELRTVGINGNGDKVYKDTVYNVRGLVDQVSQPYFAGTSPADWSYAYFDDIGRIILQVNPGEGCIGFSYDGITTEQFRVLSVKPGETLPDLTQYLNDIGGQFNGLRNSWGVQYIERVVSTKDLAGQLVSVQDNENNTLHHQYDVYGNLLATTLPSGGGTISMSYDIRGNKTEMTDPNMGTWYYCYNVLGELMEQYDAVGNAVVFEYDILGRMTKREDFRDVTVTPGNGTADDYLTGTSAGHTTWHYDRITEELTVPNDPDGSQYNDNKAVGKLILTQTSRGYKNALHYDGLGRLKLNREKNSSLWYEFETTYDTFSRPLTLKYPDGDLVIKNAYDSTYGDLESVFNETTPSTVYWEAGPSVAQYDSLGHLTQFKYGNGLYTRTDFDQSTGFLNSIKTGVNTSDSSIQDLTYGFTKVGFLSKREDHNKNLRETFTYDSLNRLEEVKLTQDVGGSESTSTANVTYNALGNILTKPGVTGTYTYGGASGGPNAVTATGSHTYLYDTNGSLLKRTLTSDTSKTQDYTWNTFNKVTTIENENNDVSTFYYGSDRQRISQHLDRTIGDDKTTYYINGGLYEFVQKFDGSTTTTEERHYINSPSGRIAVFVEEGTQDTHGVITVSSTKVDYFHYDHQGTLDKITNSVGTIVSEYSYDAWGKLRDPNDWQGDPQVQQSPEESDLTYDHGYTGHEHLEDFGIVHMNGRLYDASLGRFVSADPHVQSPDNLQNYNRYSYVLNNPLSYTDPSGYFFKKLFKKIGKFFKKYGRTILGIAAAIFVPHLLSIAGTFAGAVVGGAVSGGITDGLRGALTGAILAGVSFGIGAKFGHKVPFGSKAHIQKVVAHGVAGGTASVVRGGEFHHGFFASAVGEFSAPYIDGLDLNSLPAETAIVSVLGGTASVVAGGKFENGAVNAAFVYLFNQQGRRGFGSTKRSAFMQAKRDAGITSRDKLISQRSVPLTDRSGKVIRTSKGKPLLGREYVYQKPNGTRVAIQHHPHGHPNLGMKTPHFNVRVVDSKGTVIRNSSIPGTQGHYNYKTSNSLNTTPSRSSTIRGFGGGGGVGGSFMPGNIQIGPGGGSPKGDPRHGRHKL